MLFKLNRFLFCFLCFVNLFSFYSKAFNLADFFVVDINESEIPQGAVYLDLLVKEDEIKIFTNDIENMKFTSKNSIANYTKDGFVSYTSHSDGATEIVILNDCDKSQGTLSCDFGDGDGNIFDFSEVRFAYVSEMGAVIEVTNSVRTDSLIPDYDLEAIILNGTTVSANFVFVYQNYVFFGGIAVLAGAIYFLHRSKTTHKSKHTNQHQSGDGSVIDTDKH